MHEIATAGAGALAAPADVLATLADALRDRRSANTRRAYAAAWNRWQEWAGESGADALPADPTAVAVYLAARRTAGAGISSLRIAAAAIRTAHDATGQPLPATDADAWRPVRNVLARIARQDAGESRQARALDAEAVAAIRGALNGRADTHARAARDMALIAVMADTGLRRSEAAALTWADVEAQPDGSGRVRVRRSNTDQDRDGRVAAITPRAMADLERIAGARAPTDRVFRISASQVSRIIARRARQAGLGDGFSGHSARVGCAVRMARAGAPNAIIARQAGWAEGSRMVARYTRQVGAGEALRYL